MKYTVCSNPVLILKDIQTDLSQALFGRVNRDLGAKIMKTTEAAIKN